MFYLHGLSVLLFLFYRTGNRAREAASNSPQITWLGSGGARTGIQAAQLQSLSSHVASLAFAPPRPPHPCCKEWRSTSESSVFTQPLSFTYD